MKKLLAVGIVVVALIASAIGCKKDSRVSNIYGKVTDINAQPVEGVPLEIAPTRNWGLTSGKTLITVYTDQKGEYSATVEPEKRYGSLQIYIQPYTVPKLEKYVSYDSYSNGQPVACCAARVGRKTEYSFILKEQ